MTNDPKPKPSRKRPIRRPWPKGMPVPSIGAFSGNSKWTYDDEEVLRTWFSTHGSRYCARVLGRTEDAVKIRANRLGISRLPRWSAKEDAYLRKCYGAKTTPEMAKELGRPVVGVRNRVRGLGLTPEKPWSRAQQVLLRRHYGTMSLPDLAHLIGRTADAVRSMAWKLGLATSVEPLTSRQERTIMKFVGVESYIAIAKRLGVTPARVVTVAERNGYDADGRWPGGWSDEHNDFLRTNFATMPLPQIAEHVGRNREAVYAHAVLLGLKQEDSHYGRTSRWLPEHNLMLRELCGSLSQSEIATRMGRTRGSIKRRIAALGLGRDGTRDAVAWTRAEDRILRERYSITSIREIGHDLERSIAGVRARVEALGLAAVGRADAAWSKSEDATLRKLYAMTSNREIGARLGRSIASVTKRAHHIGLRKPASIVGSPWTPQEDAQLRTLFGTMTTIAIAGKLGRSPEGVRKRLGSMGLVRYKRGGK